MNGPTQDDRVQRPWMYVGYRDFCKFVNSDDDFAIFRKFGELNTRVLLTLQDELVELEGQLEEAEQFMRTKPTPDGADRHNGTFRGETCVSRFLIVNEIDKKLRAYNELVLQHSELRRRPQVVKKDRDSLSNWFENHRNAIHKDETLYVDHAQDLFAMVPKSKTALRRFFERSSHFRRFGLWVTPPLMDDENVHYTSDQRIDTFVNMIIALTGLFMLIVPLWVLAIVTPVFSRLAIITAFVVVFLCFVSFTTVARPFETLGAAAA